MMKRKYPFAPVRGLYGSIPNMDYPFHLHLFRIRSRTMPQNKHGRLSCKFCQQKEKTLQTLSAVHLPSLPFVSQQNRARPRPQEENEIRDT